MSDQFQSESFDSWEEMWERLTAATAAANAVLAPKQRTIGYGSNFVRFYRPDERLVIFGHVMTETEVHEAESRGIENIVDPIEKQQAIEEVRYTMNHLRERYEEGYLYGWCYSIVEVGGELGSTHRSWMWPITRELFESARAVGWNIDRLHPNQKVLLEQAYAENVAHVRSTLGIDNGPR